MSSQTPGENPPPFPPGFNFNQLPPSLQQAYIQSIQKKMAARDAINQPRREGTRGRGRGRGRGSGRKSKKDRSSSESSSFSGDDDDDSPVFQATAIDSGRRRSTRTRTRSHTTNYQDDASDTNEDNNQQETQEQNKTEGPQIDKIMGQISDQQNNRFICKLPDKSLIHSVLFTENDLKSSTESSRDLSYFKTKIEKTGTVISELGSNIIEPSNEITSTSNFCVERIIGHKQIGQEDTNTTELIDKDHYTPGYPTIGFPNIDNILAYEAPMQSPPDDIQNSFLEETGVISFHGLFASASKTNENENEEDDQKDEIQRPKQVQYYVKWCGLGENFATWETPECLQGNSETNEIFRIANIEEVPHLIDIYWENTLEKKRLINIPLTLFEPNDFPLMDRNIPLTESQKQIVNNLIQCKIDNKQEIGLQDPGSGRIGAIVSFLQILKQKFNQRCKTVIIADNDKIEKWKTALKMMTSLYFAEYSLEVGPRSIVRQWEVLTTNQDKSPKLDVLIMTNDVYIKETEALQQVKWNFVVIDSLTPRKIDVSRFPSVSYSGVENGVVRIFIENRIKSSPDFSYQEDVIFVHNDIAQTLRDRLSKQLKMKNNRSTVLSNPYPLYAEMIYCHSHPFLISSMDNLITAKYKTRFNIQYLSMEQRLDLFASSSGKIPKLLHLISNNLKTVIVCENIAMIRLLQTFLFQKRVPTYVINSPNKQELCPQNLDGVILMTRDCTSPILIPLVVNQIIFYDIGRSQDSDISLVRFFKRNSPSLNVYRLITSSSLETVLYSRFILEDTFDYFNPDCASDYLRVEAFTSTPGFELADYTFRRKNPIHQSIDPQANEHMDQKVDPLVEMICNFPGDDQLAEMTQPLFEECAMDPDFWDKVFAHSRISHIRAIEWKKSEGIRLIEHLSRNGLDNFESIANELGKTPDDAYIFCRAVLIRIFADSTRYQIANHNLTNAILWFDFNSSNFDQYEENLDYWQQIASDEPTLSTSIFTKKPFLARITNMRDNLLSIIETKWIIQTFLHIRKHPYLPNRFPGMVASYEESSQILFSMLQSFIDNGQQFSLVQSQFMQFKNMDPLTFEKFFKQIISVVHSDILSLALHSIVDGTYHQYANDKLMRPFILSSLKGPFSDSWSNEDILKLVQIAMDYYIPHKKSPTGDVEDYDEFHALTQIHSKSTNQIKTFFKEMEREMIRPRSPEEAVIIQRSFLSETKPFIFPKGSGEKYKHVMMMLSHIRAIARDGIKEFTPSVNLPPNWDASCDYALITGTIQFGFSQVRTDKMWASITHSTPEYLDIPMSRSLLEFSQYLKTPQSGNKRLLNIIVANRPIPRHIKFWALGVRHIQLNMPEHPANSQPNQQNKPPIKPQQPHPQSHPPNIPKTIPKAPVPAENSKQSHLSQQFTNHPKPAPTKMQAPISAIPIQKPAQPQNVSQPKLHTFAPPQQPVQTQAPPPPPQQVKSETSIFGFSKEINDLFLPNPFPPKAAEPPAPPQPQKHTPPQPPQTQSNIHKPPPVSSSMQTMNFQQNPPLQTAKTELQPPKPIQQQTTQPLQYKNQNIGSLPPNARQPPPPPQQQPIQQQMPRPQQPLSQSQFGFPQPTKSQPNIPTSFPQSASTTTQFKYPQSPQQAQQNVPPTQPPQNQAIPRQTAPVNVPGMNTQQQGYGPMIYRSQSQQHQQQMQYPSMQQDQPQFGWTQTEIPQQPAPKKPKKPTKKQTPQQSAMSSSNTILPPPQISSDSMFASVNMQQTPTNQSMFGVPMGYSMPQAQSPQRSNNQLHPPLEKVPEQAMPQQQQQPPHMMAMQNAMQMQHQQAQQMMQQQHNQHTKSQAKQLQQLQQQMLSMQKQQSISQAQMQKFQTPRQPSQQQPPNPMHFPQQQGMQQTPQALHPQQYPMMYYQMQYYQQQQQLAQNKQQQQQPLSHLQRPPSIPMPNLGQGGLMQPTPAEEIQQQALAKPKKSVNKEVPEQFTESQLAKDKKQKKTQRLQPRRFGFTESKLPKKFIFLP